MCYVTSTLTLSKMIKINIDNSCFFFSDYIYTTVHILKINLDVQCKADIGHDQMSMIFFLVDINTYLNYAGYILQK